MYRRKTRDTFKSYKTILRNDNVQSKREKLRHNWCLKIVEELPYRNGSRFVLS